jgi:hypothetical protein
MKKFILLFCIGVSSILSLSAWESPSFSIEGRVSYFHPFSKRIRNIYKNGWPIYELQINQSYCCNTWTAWLGGSWMGERGHSSCQHNKTRFQLGALRFGLQRQFCLSSCLQFYVGGGLSCNFLRIHDKSSYVKRHTSRNAFGGIALAGIYYYFCERYFLDLNLEYQYQKFRPAHRSRHNVQRHRADLSGIKVGGGLGLLF